MQRTALSRAIAAALAIASSITLAAPGELLAKQPGNRPSCAVGSGAYPTIQSAIDDADCHSIGVPAGVFHENVTIRRNVAIRGEGADRTVVDGSWKAAPVFLLEGGIYQMCLPAPIAATIEGMTITGGTGPAAGRPQRNGGGISAFWVDLTVKDSIVRGNSAFGHGGGISVVHGTSTVKDSVVSDNTAHAYPDREGMFGGGGIRASGCPNNLTVTDSVIRGNVSDKYGGGIFANGTSLNSAPGALIVKDSIVSGNTAALPNSGGGIFYDHMTIGVSDTTVTDNAPNNVQPGPNP